MDLEVPFPSSNPNTYTPIRRHESTINTRLLNADQEQEWTSARCHRLLRALTSRVAILKKDLSRFQSTGKNTCSKGKAAAQYQSKAVDTEWTKTKKRIRQTYSGRGGRGFNGFEATKGGSQGSSSKQGRKSFTPGEVTIPTPILARARGENSVPQAPLWVADEEPPIETVRGIKRPRARPAAADGGGSFQPCRTLRDLRQKVTATRYTIYEGIYHGLEALLRATTQDRSEERTKTKGPRSLLSMALRTVPRYISQQEGLLDAHMEETGSKTALYQRDISTEIYDELESFGSSGHGWKRLKVIVRSHGIQVILDAIQLGVFDDEFCGVLIALCINTFAIDEAQSILSALLSSRMYASPKTLYDTLDCPLSMLSSFYDFTSRTSFQFRELSNILANGLLPVEWLATKELGSVWTRAIQHLTPGIIDEDAVAFVDSALPLLSFAGANPSNSISNAVTEAAKNTFSSLLTILSSIVRLSREDQQNNCIESPTRTGYDHVIVILKKCLIQCGTSDIQILLLLSNLVVREESLSSTDPDDSLIDSLLTGLQLKGNSSRASSAYAQAVSFVCQVARCCGRVSSSLGFEHLERIHQVLETSSSEKNGSNIIHSLIVDSAFAFAQKIPDRKHIDYASSMDTKFCARMLDLDTSLHGLNEEGCDDHVSGFRWEEGIGEWVTATPALATRSKIIAPKAYADEFECDTPYRPAPKVRRLEKRPGPVVHATSSPFSSPNFDESVRVQSLAGSPSGSVLEMSESEGNEGPLLEDVGLVDSEDDINSDGSQEVLESGSEDEASKMEVSSMEQSLIVYGSSKSLASIASLERPLIERVPRLQGKLLCNSNSWHGFEHSIVSSASSAVSDASPESTGCREFVDRAPRMGRRVLSSSQAWQIFDDSDDELSILSVSSSSQSGQTLKDVKNAGTSNARRPRKVKSARTLKTRSMKVAAPSDSEDELCI
ncbi:uncharacterized protein RAG0_09353 [Rhynchosporium agropyri]|uniref:Uncharacterized protein n=1 Tax=Rhynchosporium agropyri TaxID=914238 RepID=A0A1E1KV40_9HELO|nr:uncharacterized protein RAG0_09353 [Rhynchosporium agropyri]